MADVRLSALAKADLAAIDTFSFDQFGEITANAYLRGFNDVFDLLRAHPLAGMARPELGTDIRTFTHRGHRICYQYAANTVLIVRILHHAQYARLQLGRT